jgi:hypothetical protein
VKLEDYVKAIKEVCASYNIPVYNLFEESGINESNLKATIQIILILTTMDTAEYLSLWLIN